MRIQKLYNYSHLSMNSNNYYRYCLEFMIVIAAKLKTVHLQEGRLTSIACEKKYGFTPRCPFPREHGRKCCIYLMDSQPHVRRNIDSHPHACRKIQHFLPCSGLKLQVLLAPQYCKLQMLLCELLVVSDAHVFTRTTCLQWSISLLETLHQSLVISLYHFSYIIFK